uniref:Uncharacterized protein n=1 Tax=Arundo donax TaxID=35708 RepID=A0A0A9BS78_ARUDO
MWGAYNALGEQSIVYKPALFNDPCAICSQIPTCSSLVHTTVAYIYAYSARQSFGLGNQ